MRYGLAIYPKSKEALRSLQCCKSRLLFHLVFKGFASDCRRGGNKNFEWNMENLFNIFPKR